ncbi:hypothetical protein Pelo_4587 [Pelomyxa schiedti]|nr:hypothetical protein Pelo_4587 [Pelomyxa schiedti]
MRKPSHDEPVQGEATEGPCTAPLLAPISTRNRSVISDCNRQWHSGDFDLLPDEVVIQVLSCLGMKSISRMGQTCKRMHTIASSATVWNHVAQREGLPENKPLSFYVSKYTEKREHKYAAREAVANIEKKHRYLEKKKRNTWCVQFFTSRIWEWSYPALLILFLVAATLKLEEIIFWPWIAVFAPLFAIFCHIYFCNMIFALCKPINNYRLEPREGECKTPACNFLWLNGHYIEKLNNRIIFYMYLFCPVPFLLFLFLQLSCYIMPWWIIPIPAQLISLALILTPFVARVRCMCSAPSQLMWLIFPVCGILMCTFLSLLSIKLLSTNSLTWVAVIAPLLAIEFWILLIPALLAVVSKGLRMYWTQGSRLGTMILVMDTIILGVIIVSFGLLLALTMDGFRDYQWRMILIPMYILAGFVTTATVALSVAMYSGL